MCASRSRGPGGRAGPLVLVSRPPPQELPLLLTVTSASWFAARCRSPPSPLRFRGNLRMEREKMSPCLTPHGPKPQTLLGLPHSTPGTSPHAQQERQVPRTQLHTVPPPGARRCSPESLLRGLACCLAPAVAAAARFRLLCSCQYSRQRRSWKWMKRHITEAWKRHTNSSTLILARAEKRQAEKKKKRSRAATNPASDPQRWPKSSKERVVTSTSIVQPIFARGNQPQLLSTRLERSLGSPLNPQV